MESLKTSKPKQGFHIEGFPDALKVITLNSKLSEQISSYALHKYDLNICLELLININQVDSNHAQLREALYHFAIVTFAKCFRQSKSRIQLNEKTVYKAEPKEALEAFGYFLDLRNKHIVHDENSLSQCIPGAVLNKRESDQKIAKVVCFNAVGLTLSQENYSNLHMLVSKASEWVESKFDEICMQITNDLEQVDYDDLFKMEEMTYSKPDVSEIGKPRKGYRSRKS